VSNPASVVQIPPFRNRPEEIWWHVEFMTQDPSKLSSEVMAAFLNYRWGSLAELKSALAEFLATGAMPVLSHEQRVESSVPGSLFDAMTNAYRCSIYVAALESTGGRVGEAANRLGIPERTFRRHTTELNVPKERFRASGKRNKKK
jgi:transcriptional regulator of acetoin/glycerol metabolism